MGTTVFLALGLGLYLTPLRPLFFLVFVRPIMLVAVGLNVRHRERLPLRGPAIVAANHNSHLDTLALMSLFPLATLRRVRPVAAADHFLKNRFLAWFSQRIIGIIPIKRSGFQHDEHPLAGAQSALERGEILILFPEGSRGEPEQISQFKSGIAHLIKDRPEIPISPVFLHGFGKVLPRGEAILVPFFCDVFIGAPLFWDGSKSSFMERLSSAVMELSEEGEFPPWQ